MKFKPIDTGKPVDRRYDYSPAVAVERAGLLFLSGMVSWDAEGKIVGVGDPEAQARQAFENLKDTLAASGATLADVVMETEYVVDMAHYKAIGRVRRQYFQTNRPAATLVQVQRLFRPELLFEIQAIAVLP